MTDVGGVSFVLSLTGQKTFQNNISNVAKTSENIMTSAMNSIKSVIVKTFAVGAIASFSKASISAASLSQSAWTGLNTIIKGQGKSFKTAEGFINEYVSDGLVPLNNAISSYKNLLLRGYNTSEIEKIMNAFKDSAAFSRQSSYTMGEAIQTATEGLKNENSVVVDNVGVTKNVAKMWEEYAVQIGTTANKLTLAQKRQAEINGILEETKFQTGDAKAYTETYAGRIAQLGTAFMNLKVAVGNVLAPIASIFIPVINGAINAVTRMINKIGQLLELLGLKFPKIIEKGGNSALNNFAANTNKASQGMLGASNQAKKTAKEINRAFASVDDLNIVNIPDNDSGIGNIGAGNIGAGNIGADSGAPTTEIGVAPANDNNIIEAVGETTSKLMKYIEPLKNISFENLINSFDRLKKSIQPITEKLGKGLEWFYFNILVPLSRWTIEEALPTFLDLLSAALKVVNPLLESFSRIFKPIWDNILKPIASYTADAFINTMKDITKALENIGNWMSDNKETVDKITKSVILFFVAWEITKLVAFIEVSGGVSAVLGVLAAKIWAVTGAKIADKLETMATIVLYARDAAVKVINTIKTWLSVAATTAHTVATKIFTAAIYAHIFVTKAVTVATTAFSVALKVLMGPVGLIILAIGALIGIVILLVKNWDKVKIAAQACWNGIKAMWSSAASWFNNVVINPIKNAFNSIKTFVSNIFNSVVGTIKGVMGSIGSFVKAPINGIISGANRLISKVNSIRVPDWVPGLGGLHTSFPQIPMLAQGAYIGANNPKLAIIGDNKREGEIVSPESKIRENVKQVLEEMKGTVSDIYLNIKVVYEDGKTIIKKINTTQKEAGSILLEV